MRFRGDDMLTLDLKCVCKFQTAIKKSGYKYCKINILCMCVSVIATLLVWVNSHFEIWCLSSLASKGYFTYSNELGKRLTINEIHYFSDISFLFIYIHMQFICSVIFNTFKASKLFSTLATCCYRV